MPKRRLGNRRKMSIEHEGQCGRCVCNSCVLARVVALYKDLLIHDGFGEIRLEVRILKRGQKEVIIHCGKQYRYVVDFQPGSMPEDLQRLSVFIEQQVKDLPGDEGSWVEERR